MLSLCTNGAAELSCWEVFVLSTQADGEATQSAQDEHVFLFVHKKKSAEKKNIQPSLMASSLSRPVVSAKTSSSHTRGSATNTKQRSSRLVWVFERKLNVVTQQPERTGSRLSLSLSFLSPSGQPGNHCFMDSMNADGQKVT